VQVEKLVRAAQQVGFKRVATFVIDASFFPKHFLVLNPAEQFQRIFHYFSTWEEPPFNILSTLLLGMKPDYRPALGDELPLPALEDLAFFTRGPGIGRTSALQLTEPSEEVAEQLHLENDSVWWSLFRVICSL
jgi:hypothetical protein